MKLNYLEAYIENEYAQEISSAWDSLYVLASILGYEIKIPLDYGAGGSVIDRALFDNGSGFLHVMFITKFNGKYREVVGLKAYYDHLNYVKVKIICDTKDFSAIKGYLEEMVQFL